MNILDSIFGKTYAQGKVIEEDTIATSAGLRYKGKWKKAKLYDASFKEIKLPHLLKAGEIVYVFRKSIRYPDMSCSDKIT